MLGDVKSGKKYILKKILGNELCCQDVLKDIYSNSSSIIFENV